MSMARWLNVLGGTLAAGLWRLVWQYFRRDRHRIGLKKQEPAIAELARHSHREWEMAHRFFNEVTDPDLVDTAIHLISAYEKHYNYLLRQMRQAQNS